MQLKQIKIAAEAPIKGVEFVKVDGSITEVIIGGLRIRKGESYSPGLQVLIEVAGETVQRHKVVATLDGFEPAVKYVESSWDADALAAKLEATGAKVTKDLLSVVISDSGEIVEIGAPSGEAAEDLPF